MQDQIFSEFYFFFFISNLKYVGSNSESSKSTKFCLHKKEIASPLVPVMRTTRSCHTIVKSAVIPKMTSLFGSMIFIPLCAKNRAAKQLVKIA